MLARLRLVLDPAGEYVRVEPHHAVPELEELDLLLVNQVP
jgi:hypothetical protein